jgi:hypothetical protein
MQRAAALHQLPRGAIDLCRPFQRLRKVRRAGAYDHEVLDIDAPAFRAGMDRLFRLSERMDAAKARGSIVGRLQQAGLALAGAAAFAKLYLLPVKHHALPQQVRVAPAW